MSAESLPAPDRRVARCVRADCDLRPAIPTDDGLLCSAHFGEYAVTLRRERFTDPARTDNAERAQALATRAHADRVDKVGAAYFGHPAGVA